MPPRSRGVVARMQHAPSSALSKAEVLSSGDGWTTMIATRPMTIARETCGRFLVCGLGLLVLYAGFAQANARVNLTAQVHSLRITNFSTMLVGEPTGIGEWGFAA